MVIFLLLVVSLGPFAVGVIVVSLLVIHVFIGFFFISL